MTEKEYKELNGYLNEMFIYLDKYYKFILNHLLEIFVLNDEYLKIVDEYYLSAEYKENKLTYKEVYDYARKIIEVINKDYLKLYDDLIETGKLDFSYDSEYHDSHYYYSFKKDVSLININRSFNYDDIISLIHEFFHYTNMKNGNSFERTILTEFVSIYFELFSIKYLLNNGVSKEELGYIDRIGSTLRRTDKLALLETPLLAYYKSGDLSDKSVEFLNKYFIKSLTKEQFCNECKHLLNYFRKVKKEYTSEIFSHEVDNKELQKEYSNMIISHFKYFFGTMWAYYAIDNCDIKDIVRVNNYIANNEKDFSECMEIMKIDEFDYKTYEKAFESITNYINKFNVKRK